MIKTYKIICWVVLGIVVYFLLLPIISFYMSNVMPEIWKCAFKSITGKPCPYCSITTDFKTIFQEKSINFHFKNQISLFIFIFLIFQLIYRPILLYLVYSKNTFLLSHLKTAIFFECITHCSAFIYFIIWSIHRFISII